MAAACVPLPKLSPHPVMRLRRFFLHFLSLVALAHPLPALASYGESDADLSFNVFNNAFYVGNGGQAYYRESTAGGRAWFWTQANMIEMVADAYDRAPTQGRRDMLSALCNGFMDYHGQDWTWNEYNDDVLWACIVFAKAYRITGTPLFRDRSIANFNMVWNRAWSNHLDGGLFWRTDNQTKNTCVNCPGAIVACLLYEITGDRGYLVKAQQIMTWVDGHLLRPDGALDDHQRLDGGLVGWRFTYNQGTYVGACSALFRITGNHAYLDNAIKAARYTRNSMCNGAGIFPDHGTTGDGGGFNGVGIRWIAKMVREQGLWREFYPWLKSNADAAWNNRRADGLSWSNWRATTLAGSLEGFACYGSVVALQVVPAANPDSARVAPAIQWTQTPVSRVPVGSPLNLEARSIPGTGGGISAMSIAVNGIGLIDNGGDLASATWTPPAAGAYRIEASATDLSGNLSKSSLLVTAGNPVTPAGLTSGLVAWYRSDSGVVGDGEGRVSVWQDLSGNQRDAAQAFSEARPGLVQRAFGQADGIRFDGSDFLTAGTGMPLGSYTKVLRFKLEDASDVGNLLSSPVMDASAGDHSLRVSSGKPALVHSGQAFTSTSSVGSGVPVVVVASFDGYSRVGRVFLNGTQVAGGYMAQTNAMSGIQIGAFAGQDPLRGTIGEILLYSRVLGVSEISTLTQALVSQEKTPLDRWKTEHFGNSGFQAGVDSDGDGLPDLVEYALGSNPKLADGGLGRGLSLEITDGLQRVSYGLAVDRPGVRVALEGSDDLAHWVELLDAPRGGSGGVNRRAYEAAFEGGGNGKAFYRLKATEP